MNKSIVVGVVVAAAWLWTGAVGGLDVGHGAGEVGPRQWRVIWTESPQTRAVVAWSTGEEGADVDHRVLYDTRPHPDGPTGYAATVACHHSREFSEDDDLFCHHAELRDLQPDTVYYFRMQSGDAHSRELHFRTAPATDQPFTLLQGGDSRSDRDVRRRINQRIARLAHEDPGILALAHGGDYVWNGRSMSEWSDWMTDHELTVTPDGRILPIIPARGNHEASGVIYDEVFAAPGGGLGKNYFATELSPAVLWITLNTEVAAGGRQREFLRATLEQHGDRRWKAVQYHRAIWPAVKGPARAREHWQGLFDEHGVDLVCESDGHALKRTVPIRGDEPHPEGVVYVGEGGFGVKQRRVRSKRWYLEDPGTATSAHHVWELRFEAERLALRAVGVDGAVLDECVLRPRVAATAK